MTPDDEDISDEELEAIYEDAWASPVTSEKEIDALIDAINNDDEVQLGP